MARQFETVAIPKRLQLATQFTSRDDTFAKSSRIINGYVERDQVSGEFNLYKRPGLSTIQYSAASVGKGVYYFETFPGIGKLISIVGNTVVSHNLVTLAGTNIGVTAVGPSAVNNFVIIPSVGGTPAKLVFGDGTTAYWTDGATVTQLLGANNFPTGTDSFFRGWSYLDGFLFVFRIFRDVLGTTGLDDPDFWDLLNLIQANQEPDFGIALAKHLNYAVALKQWTTEFFYDAGNAAGSPLSRLQGAALPYGCLHAGTVQDFDGMLLFVSTNRTSGPQVSIIRKMQHSVISNPSVERILRLAATDTWYSQVFRLGGHRFYVVSALNADFTFVYDLDQELWYQWTSSTGGRWTPIYSTYLPSATAGKWRYVVQDSTGNLYFAGEAYEYTNDAGVVCPFDLYMLEYDAGTRRSKNLGAMLFDADPVPGILKIRHNDSHYATDKWSNFREVNLATIEPQLTDCGSFINRAWHMRYEGNTTLRLKTVDLQLDIGTL